MRLQLLGLLLFLLVPAPAPAQLSDGDLRAFRALSATPIGALTTLVSPGMLGRDVHGAQLGVRYGLQESNTARTQAIGLSALFGAGMGSSLSLTAGVSDADCNGCPAALMLGAGAATRVFDVGEAAGTGTSLAVALSGDFGFAQLKPGDDYALSFGVGAPVTLTFIAGDRDGMRIVPYLTPVFGIGQTSGDCLLAGCARNGTRWVLGGGIAVWNPTTSVTASLGINQVAAPDSRPTYGVSVIFGGN